MNEIPYFGTTGFGIKPNFIASPVTASSTTLSKSFDWKRFGFICLVLVIVGLFCLWMYRTAKRKDDKRKDVKKTKTTETQGSSSINRSIQTNRGDIELPKEGLDKDSDKNFGNNFGRRDWLI